MFVRSIPQSLLNEFKSPWFNWLTSFFGLLQSFQLRRPPCWSRYKINRGGWPNNIILPTMLSFLIVISLDFFFSACNKRKQDTAFFFIFPPQLLQQPFLFFFQPLRPQFNAKSRTVLLLNHSGEGKNQFSFWYSRSFYFIISFFDSVTTFADRISLKRAKTLKQFNLFRYSTNTTTTLCSLRGRVTFWESRSNRISCFLSLPVSQLYFWFRKNVFT